MFGNVHTSIVTVQGDHMIEKLTLSLRGLALAFVWLAIASHIHSRPACASRTAHHIQRRRFQH